MREAEREAALIRREAAAWAATTRREADEYREQVVRDLEARARQLEEQIDEVDTVVIDLLGRADDGVEADGQRRITAR